MSRLPEKAMDFRNTSSAIAEFISPSNGYGASDYPWAKKMLGKFPLPPWQRDSVWTLEQKVGFIQSVYLGYDLGSVVINDCLYLNNDTLGKFSDCLIDGQQRLEAIFDYTNNEFSVYGLFWKELNRSEQNRFKMRELGKRMVNCFDDEKLRQVYNHLNFSGTRHEENERA
jgi:uncharacterized protein with ParB-like and HNH nuclease domain